jgi:ketosteroid isomerase-like protein
MRFTQLALVIAVGIASPPSVLAQAKGKDELAVRKILSDFAATWNANDMGAFGQLFATDADFVVITGKLLKGRSEIQGYHSGSRAAYIRAVASCGFQQP